MNRVTAAAGIHLQDKFSWFALPWLVLSLSFFINLAISHLLVDETMVTGGIATIHIFMLVVGIIAMTSTFPFAIGFSVRRTDFVLGTYAVFAGTSLLSGVLLWLLGAVEQATNGWGSDLRFFHLPYMSDGSAVEQIAIQSATMLFCFFTGFLPPCLYRRFGMKGMLIVCLALLLLGTVGGYALTYLDVWPTIFDFAGSLRAIDLAGGLFLIAVIDAVIGYLLLRRATVR